MKRNITLAILAGSPLVLFLLVRPFFGGLGDAKQPYTLEKARITLPESLPDLVALGEETIGYENLQPRDVSQLRSDEAVEREILRQTNGKRQSAGVATLQDETQLTQIARAHGLDMAARRYFAHVNPEGQSQADRIAEKHRRMIGLTGENLWKAVGLKGISLADLAKEIIDSWMDSPGHRRNLLDPSFTHLGVGVVVLGDEIWAVQNFGNVVAYLNNPLKSECKPEESMVLDHQPLQPRWGTAAMFDLWSAGMGHAVMEGQPLEQPLPKIPPGTYKLRFYFRENPNEFAIVYGPQIEVNAP